MLFLRLLNYIKGYLIIAINGNFAERFINICAHRGILIWDISRKNGGFTAKISVDDFYKLREVARITKSKVRIKYRCGLPFLLNRYKSRWPIVFAIVLFIAIINFTSTHIMSVDITGNERIEAQSLREDLSSIGVSFGKKISDLEPDTIRNEMIVLNDDIAWLGVNISGSRVFIEITERIDKDSIPQITDEECNIVAKKDGVIDKLEVKQGQTMVKKGDGVEKGDILVSGVVDSTYGGFRTVHSYGEVYAKTEYKSTQEYPLNYIDKEYSGDQKRILSVNLFGNEFDLYPSNLKPQSESNDEETSEYVYRGNVLGKDIEIGGSVKYFSEYETINKQRTINEAVELGVREMTDEVVNQIPDDAEIINKKSEHNIITGDLVSVTVTYECRENIAEERVIDKSLIDKNGNLDYDIEEKGDLEDNVNNDNKRD